MKKILTLLALLCAVTAVNAQLRFAHDGNIYASGDTVYFEINETNIEDGFTGVHIDIVNQGSEAVSNSTVTATTIEENGIMLSGMCAGECGTGNTTPAFEVAAGETYTGFVADFAYDPTIANGTVALYGLTIDSENDYNVILKIKVNTEVGIANIASQVALNAYPNPAHSQFNITFTLPQNSTHGEVVIYNILGSRIAQQSVTSSDSEVRFDISTLPYGVYMYGIQTNGKLLRMKKFVVE